MIGIPRSAKAAMVAATTVGLFVIGAPAAHASGDTITGGCFASTDEHSILTNGQNQGILVIASVTRDASGLENATVACWIDVNGVEQPGTRLTDTNVGVQLAQQQIAYLALDDDVVTLCEQVHFWNDNFDTGPVCQPTVIRVIVPTPVVGPVNQIFPNDIDPLLCPEFRSLHGDYGPVTIATDGDISIPDPLGLGYNPIYDCPPY